MTRMTADSEDTHRRLISLITRGVGPTYAWDFHLCHDLGLPEEHVASMRGVTPGTVRGNLSKVRQRLGLPAPDEDDDQEQVAP